MTSADPTSASDPGLRRTDAPQPVKKAEEPRPEDGSPDRRPSPDTVPPNTVPEAYCAFRDAPAEVHLRSAALLSMCVLAIGTVLYFTRAITMPFTIAVVLCLLLRPVVRLLARYRVPYPIGAGLVVISLAGVVAGGLYQLSTPASQWMASIPQHVEELRYKVEDFRKPIEQVSKAQETVENLTDGDTAEKPVKVQVQQPGVVGSLLNTTGSVAGMFAMVVVLLYFLLASGDVLLNKIVESLPRFRDKRTAVEAAREIERGISSYLFTVSLINICLGLAIGLAMWLLGMPNPALWGVMATALNFVPYLGAFVGAGVVAVVALLEFSSPSYALLVPVVYLSLTSLEGQIITPSVLGRSMSLNPLMVLIFLIFWSWLWGIGGALIAVPLLAIAKICCDHVERLEGVGRFLGD